MDPDRRPDQDELDSPYAPPDSTFAQEFPLAPLGRIPFNVGDIFNWTWTLYKQQIGTCTIIVIGVALINVGLAFGINILLDASAQAIRDEFFLAAMRFAAIFGSYVIQFWLSAGMSLALLRIVRRQQVSFQDVFTGGQYVLTTILAALLCGLICAGPILLAFVGGAAVILLMQNGISALPLLLMIIIVTAFVTVAFYLSARLMQFYFVIVDRNAGVIESLQTSWLLTKNRVSTLILVYLLQTTINLAGLLACCVGLVFALPLSNLLLAVTYQALTGQTPVAEVRFLDSWDLDQDEG